MSDKPNFNSVVGFDTSDPARAALQADVAVDVATAPDRSVRTSISRQPYKKGWLLGAFVVVSFAGMFWLYYFVTNRMSISSTPEAVEPEDSEIEQLVVQPESAAVVDGSKTRMALGEQANDLDSFQVRALEPEDVPPVPVAANPPPAQPQPTSTPDPLQVWNQLQSVGSFGEVQVAANSTSVAANPPSRQHQSPDSNARLASLVASRETSSSEVAQTPAIDMRLEREFFNGGPTGRTVAAGTMAAGTIQSPAIWSPYDESSESTELFVIQLSGPLLDTSGYPIVPTGSELSVRIRAGGAHRLRAHERRGDRPRGRGKEAANPATSRCGVCSRGGRRGATRPGRYPPRSGGRYCCHGRRTVRLGRAGESGRVAQPGGLSPNQLLFRVWWLLVLVVGG